MLDDGSEDDEDLTSIMSADQRKALQRAASTSKEAESLERDTARPPAPVAPTPEEPEVAAMPVIPKAPAVPNLGKPVAKPAPKPSPEKAAKPARDADVAPPPAALSWPAVVAFLLLAAAVVASLR